MSKPKIEKPESSKKFTDEELQEVKEIQQNYVEIQHRLGQLSVAKIRLEQQQDALGKQEDTLTGKFKEAQQIEKEFISGITEKYGDGVLDPETGRYNQTPEETDK